jgi:lipopolysaccharide/colanic/teichoic acid biosynthesis glycosyltransferase/nucleoside-diphosphate-sugar epimerase
MSNPKILITGANGFIGFHLIETLSKNGFVCLAHVRKPNEAVQKIVGAENMLVSDGYDIFGKKDILKDVDLVVHCAARVHQMHDKAADPSSEFRKVNREVTVELAKLSCDVGVKKFIFLSSVKVMGDFDGTDHVYSEVDAPQPTDPYGQSKWEAEQELAKIFADSASSCVILRLPMVYGPGNKGNMLSLLAAAKRKIPLPLKSAKGLRSMVYSGNIGDAVACIAQKGISKGVQTFFLTDGEDHTSGELYDEIYTAMHARHGIFAVPLWFLRMPGLVNPKLKPIISRLLDEYRFSSEAFQKKYSWTPRYAFKEGIAATVRWYQTKCASDSPGEKLSSSAHPARRREALGRSGEQSRRMKRSSLHTSTNFMRTVPPQERKISGRICYLIIKRVLDIAAALMASLVLSGPLAIIAILIKATSTGPVIHWSRRIGKNNIIFKMAKFRTMYTNAPQVATHLLANPDQYVTPIGKFLRKYSLDELPQLVNILTGDISVVGPRPALFNQDDLRELRTQKGVHAIAPGLTGWAQVNGRDELPIPVKVEYDEFYLTHRSLLFDLKIIFLTLVKVAKGEGVTH